MDAVLGRLVSIQMENDDGYRIVKAQGRLRMILQQCADEPDALYNHARGFRKHPLLLSPHQSRLPFDQIPNLSVLQTELWRALVVSSPLQSHEGASQRTPHRLLTRS